MHDYAEFPASSSQVADQSDNRVAQRGGAPKRAAAVRAPAEIVDDDPGSLTGKQQRVFPTDTSTGPGDDGDSTCERLIGSL
jgi:hypothetical protein